MIGVESCIASPSGETTSGMIGSFAYFWYSAADDGPRTIHSCGICL